MKNYRLGNTITIKWTIMTATGTAYNLNASNLELFAVVPNHTIKIDDFSVAGNVVTWTFLGTDQKFTGPYTLTLIENRGQSTMMTVDYCNAFGLVRWSCQAGWDESADVNSNLSLTSEIFTHQIALSKEVQDAIDGNITEYNVSNHFPTDGIDGTNRYTLETAIAKIPASLRTVGIKCSFLNEAGQVETWEYHGGSYLSVSSWIRSDISAVNEKIDSQKAEVDAAKNEAMSAIDNREQEVINNFNAQRVTPEMLSEATKQLINSSGGGTINNLPDDEDITSTGGDTPVLKFKDRKPDHGKGYVILRRNKTFTEQVTQANTIYEIRYDFDLGSASLTLPDNVILYFTGGNIVNGSIQGNGLKTINATREILSSGIFIKGVNLDGNALVSSNIGMVEGEAGSAINDSILDEILAKSKSLTLNLDGEYYFAATHNITGSLSIKGGIFNYTKNGIFKMEVGSSIVFENVRLSANGNILIYHNGELLDYVIDSIIFKDCTFDGNLSIVRLFGADVPYESTPHGLKNFQVCNCHFDISMTAFVLNDLCVTDSFMFSGNTVRNMVYSLLHLGETNEYTNNGDKEAYWADVIFENNDIRGTVATTGSSYLSPLISDAQNRIFFRNNIVSNIIGTDSQVCYDCYGSTNEYYCENNIFKNIVHLHSTGIAPATFPEFFKSKGGGALRLARGNRWEIDFNDCRTLCSQAGITWTDEQFKNISFISMFQFVAGDRDKLLFENNNVIVRNGRIRFRQSSYPFKEVFFKGNTLQLDEIEKGWEALIPCWNEDLEKIVIENNIISVNNNGIYLIGAPSFSSPQRAPNLEVYIRNNIINNCLILPLKGSYNLYASNNSYPNMNNNIVFGSGVSCNTGGSVMHGRSSLPFYTSEAAIFLENTQNLLWDFDVKIAPSEKSLLNIYDNRYETEENNQMRPYDYDIVIKTDGRDFAYKVRYTESLMTAYDEWDNILVQENFNIESNGSWITVYQSEATRIGFQATVKRKMLLRIYFLNDTWAEKTIRIADPKYGIVKSLMSNRYSVGEYRFDRTTKKPLWWDGSKWVDATGTVN